MKTVIIGMGRMGQRHLQVCKDLELDVVGVYDLVKENAQEALTSLGYAPSHAYDDIDLLFSSTDPELLIVATTAPSHCDYVLRAAERGVGYILCEKPMGISLAECDRMIACCESKGVKLAINHQMRFMEQFTRIKALAHTPEFGGLESMTFIGGNFGLAMNGCHYFEAFRYMMDEDPFEVAAYFSDEKVPNPRGDQFEDQGGSVIVKTASGKHYYMNISTGQGHGLFMVYGCRYGQIRVDELTGNVHQVCRQHEYRELPMTRYGMPADEASFQIAPADAVSPTRAVIEALIRGENYPTGEQGRLAVRTLIASYVSHENGGSPIRIDGPLPQDRVFPWA